MTLIEEMKADIEQHPLDRSTATMERAIKEIERLRDGLTAITCESINAEAMAQNVLDGLPPYHGMGMIKPNGKAKPTAVCGSA